MTVGNQQKKREESLGVCQMTNFQTFSPTSKRDYVLCVFSSVLRDIFPF